MTVRMVFQQDWLRREAGRLTTGPGGVRVFPAGRNRTAEADEWLLGPGASLVGASSALALAAGDDPAGLPALAAVALGRSPAAAAVGVGPAAGGVAAAAREGGPASRVTVLGPAWLALEGAEPGLDPVPAGDDLLAAHAVWSRTIGALGRPAWGRLCGLSMAVIGCGRSGSLLTAALARVGVRRLILVDPDGVEPHNLGETIGLPGSALHRRKADAVADECRRQSPWPRPCVEPVGASVVSLRALDAVKRADVLVCAVDDPAARLHVACLAALYLRPMLDLGTGIPLGGGLPGADVRLVLPGRCLLDTGGLPGWSSARDELLAGGGLRPGGGGPEAFRDQRQGSLLSLNGVGVFLGMRLFEEMVLGRLAGSVWLQLETAPDGVPSVQRRTARPAPACRLCRWAGAGDAGAHLLRDVVKGLRE